MKKVREDAVELLVLGSWFWHKSKELTAKNIYDTMDDTRQLNELDTHWTQVQLAVGGDGPAATKAQEEIFRRYGGAIRRYLQAAVGDPIAVDELTQEFALALVSGGFEQVDRQRGRFRDYVKGVLFRMVRKHRRQRQRQAKITSIDLTDPDSFPVECAEHFRQDWRDELLARTWAALASDEPTYFTVLHFRAAHPDLSSDQMVEHLGPQLGKQVSADGIRQTLRRARKRFVDLLLAEVAGSLEFPAPSAIQDELRELDLASFVLPPVAKKV